MDILCKSLESKQCEVLPSITAYLKKSNGHCLSRSPTAPAQWLPPRRAGVLVSASRGRASVSTDATCFHYSILILNSSTYLA